MRLFGGSIEELQALLVKSELKRQCQRAVECEREVAELVERHGLGPVELGPTAAA